MFEAFKKSLPHHWQASKLNEQKFQWLHMTEYRFQKNSLHMSLNKQLERNQTLGKGGKLMSRVGHYTI